MLKFNRVRFSYLNERQLMLDMDISDRCIYQTEKIKIKICLSTYCARFKKLNYYLKTNHLSYHIKNSLKNTFFI